MARRATAINLLPPKAVSTKGKGRHADGGGLYLQVVGNSRSWLFVYRWEGRRIEMGLGRAGDRLDEISLKRARELATEARAMLNEVPPRSPLGERRATLAAARQQDEKPTFADFADRILEKREGSFRNEKHRGQWRTTLSLDKHDDGTFLDTGYCLSLRKLRVDWITTEHVLAVLQPIWSTKTETASRVRGRIEFMLDAAKAKGLREGENPARWRGHLDKLLAPRQKLQRGHMAAMPFGDVPAFVARLREREAVAARALEFLILTAARSGEVRGATWSEIDLEAKVWTVPAPRMKMGKEHRVPLSDRAVAILKEVEPLRGKADLVFPGSKEDAPLSDMVWKALMKRMGVEGVTTHGFRSAFRDWVGDATNFPRELAEAALAHKVGDEVEQAYRRSDALEKRRKLMTAWDRFVAGGTASIVRLSAARA